MKKWISILFVLLLIGSLLTLPALAEGTEASVESTAAVSAPSPEEEKAGGFADLFDIDFNRFLGSFQYMGIGMLCIFIVILAIIVVTSLISNLTAKIGKKD